MNPLKNSLDKESLDTSHNRAENSHCALGKLSQDRLGMCQGHEDKIQNLSSSPGSHPGCSPAHPTAPKSCQSLEIKGGPSKNWLENILVSPKFSIITNQFLLQ